MVAAALEGQASHDDSSSEEEPWDQRGVSSSSVDSSTLRAVAAHEQLMLEEGDLPALVSNSINNNSNNNNKTEPPTPKMIASGQQQPRSSPPRAGWLLRSGQTNRRPLHPPSLAGMTPNGEPISPSSQQQQISPTESEKGRQQQFWRQLDTDEDDGPDDELAARKSDEDEHGTSAALDRIMGKHVDDDDGATKESSLDNHSTAEETVDYSQNGAPTQSGVNTSNDGGDFCGQTLTAINEMCGGGLEQTNSTEAKSDPPAVMQEKALTPRLPLKSDEQEEYTAIEVEFVESAGKQVRRSPSGTPTRKGPLSPVDVPDDEKEGGDQDGGDGAQVEEARVQPDTTAKRTAFLSALARKAKTDFDKAKASRQKMEQHQAIESKSSGDSMDDDIYSSFSAPEKRKFLKLINTGHLPVDASRKILEAREAKEAKEKAQREKKEQAANRKNQRNKRLAFWKKNRSSSSAAAMPLPATPSQSQSADEADIEEEPVEEDEREVESSESEEEIDAASPRPVIPAAAVSAMIAMEVKNPRPRSLSPPPPPPPLEEMEGGVSQSDEERFARSGINYYDAVRRDTSDTDDDVAQVGAARLATPADKKKRRMRPRGFSALREGVRSKSAPRASRIPEPVSEDEPVHFSTQTRTMDSVTVVSGEPTLQAAPTNHTHDKRAQSKGWVHDGDDVFEGTNEDNVKRSTGQPIISPVLAAEKSRSVSAPRLGRETAERQEPPTPKEANFETRDGDVGSSPDRSRGLIVANIGQAKKIGKDDEEMLARIEKDLLSTAQKREKELLSAAPKSDTTAKPNVLKGRSVSSPKPRSLEKEALFSQEEKKQNDFQLTLDVDIDTYMHSADVYSNAGRETPYSNAHGRETPHSDGKSVVTGASTYTASSRRRRPGAARTRLAKAKEMFQKQAAKKKGLGWHDSIQAAAASTNRVWKPGTGWVDYVDTPEQTLQSPRSEDKIHVNLKKALAKNQYEELDASERSAVQVPFPKDWETERQHMLASGPSTPNDRPTDSARSSAPGYTRSIAPSSIDRQVVSPTMERTAVSPPAQRYGRSIDVLGAGMPTEPSPHEPLPVYHDNASPAVIRRSEKLKRTKKHSSPARARLAQKQEKKQDKPIGWLASMQAATAALGQDGKSWDLENGWSIPDEDERRISDVVDFNVSPPRSPPPPPPPETETIPIDVLRQSPPPRGPDGKLTQWVEKSVKGAKAGSSAADISERAVASGASTTDPDLDSSGRVSAAVVGVTTEPEVATSDRVVAAGVSTEPDVYSSSRMVAGVSTEPDVGTSSRTAGSGGVFGVSTESSAKISSRSAGVVGTSTESYKQTSGSIAIAGTSTEPYVQISDTGSVRAHESGASVGRRLNVPAKPELHSQVESEEEAHISSDSVGAFPSMNDRPVSAIVDIQKIDEDDLNLFPEETREKRADRGFIASPARTPPRRKSPTQTGSPPAQPPSLQAGISADSGDSSRRGGGPIDTDEVDETWDSDDDQRVSSGWESRSGNASASSKPSPTPTKSIPKLKGSKRDTSPIRSRRLPARPGPESDVLSDVSASKPDESASSEVRLTRKELEARSRDGPPNWPSEMDDVEPGQRGSPTAEWKSFIGKKVHAETAAASQQRARSQGRTIAGVRSKDEDSLFQFEEKKQPATSPGDFKKSDLSPIKARNLSRDTYSDGEDQPESVVYGSEGYGPTPQDGRTFLQRLTECAAPVVASAKNQVGPLVESARNSARDLSSEHLAFMKGGQGPLGCGKPDVIDEEGTVDLSTQASASVQEREGKPRSESNPKPRRGGSSVASDDFGAKTAYLEAIAMKAAVSKPRRSSSRGRAGSASVASSATSQHSEKWKSFLERKKASGVSPGKGRSSNVSDVSKAAERYAAAKLAEMEMNANANSVSSPGARRDLISRNTYSEDTEDDYRKMHTYQNRQGSSVGAAQELSAARVEAMMAALSGSVDEAEI